MCLFNCCVGVRRRHGLNDVGCYSLINVQCRMLEWAAGSRLYSFVCHHNNYIDIAQDHGSSRDIVAKFSASNRRNLQIYSQGVCTTVITRSYNIGRRQNALTSRSACK